MKLTHEDRVENFYSHGAKDRCLQDGGFLSFGHWENGSETYHQAVESLIKYILRFEKPMHSGSILNVACGYGAETMKIYETICPNTIYAIDITESHIEFAKQTAAANNVSSQIIFEKMDACKLQFGDKTFDYVIAIEGPAHFNTREIFLQNAYQVLNPNGVLLLADIIVNRQVTSSSLYKRFISSLCAKYWYMPKENWMSIEELQLTLESIGFRIDTIESIGGKVYPGFAKFNLLRSSIKNAIRIRGLRIGIGLTFLSWLLGYTYKHHMIDYVFVRAVKK